MDEDENDGDAAQAVKRRNEALVFLIALRHPEIDCTGSSQFLIT
jgi:hypothetical protein